MVWGLLRFEGLRSRGLVRFRGWDSKVLLEMVALVELEQ
jgi:hypothetical protein